MTPGGGLGRASVRGAALRGAGIALAMAVTILLTRLLGPAGFGTYALAFAVLGIVSIPLRQGLDQMTVRETAAVAGTDAAASLAPIWSAAGTVALAGGAVIAGGLLAASLFASSGAGAPSGAEGAEVGLAQTLRASAPLALLLPLVVLGSAALRGLGHPLLGQLHDQLIRPLFVLVGLALVAVSGVIWGNASLDPAGAVTLQVVAAAASLLVVALLLRRAWPAGVRLRARWPDRLWWVAFFPLAVKAGLQGAIALTDTLLLGVFEPAEAVGRYRVALQLALLVGFGVQVVNPLVAPRFARAHRDGDRALLAEHLRASTRIAGAAALVMVVVFLVAGRPLIALLFGAAFVAAWPALCVLALGRLVNAAFGPLGLMLTMSGHEMDALRALVVAVVVNLVLNLALIPPFGITGAAAATATSLLVWNLVLARAVRRAVGIGAGPGARPS